MRPNVKFNKRALLIGSAVFIVLWLIESFLLNFVANYDLYNQHSYSLGVIGYVFGPLSLAISGYVAARIAGQDGFLHGLVVGLIALLVKMLGIAVVFDTSTLFRLTAKTGLLATISAILVSGIGGAIGEIWPKR